ncbi:MAG: hypothetical protein GY953_37065, partial [bacterium]|nr:hypothetical protein [bacterium]
MLFRIEVTRSAEADIDEAYFWIYGQNPEYASGRDYFDPEEAFKS